MLRRRSNGSASPATRPWQARPHGPRSVSVPAPDPLRGRDVEVRRFPPVRRMVTAAVRAGRGASPMHGLLDVDITEARRLLEASGQSLTAFIVASVARTTAAHPQVHAYRNWRGQLLLHRYVDVATIIEVSTRHGAFGLAHVVRDADIRRSSEIGAELDTVKGNPRNSPNARKLTPLVSAAIRLPGLVSAVYSVARRSTRLRRMTGTVSVTAIGMFSGGGGFGIAPPGPASLKIVVGGMSVRPRIVDGEVVARDVLDLTVTFDHNVVDGAPAARFVADLRRLIESAEVLRG
ncbi:MAG: dehydrogenase [Pseudonocardiaceae bacterium]|nr:dehydrogenase [Pseudonocardiaceae bacterium]